MVQRNVPKHTKYTIDKRLETVSKQIFYLLHIDLPFTVDSAQKTPWFIISSHTDIKLKICLSLLNLRK